MKRFALLALLILTLPGCSVSCKPDNRSDFQKAHEKFNKVADELEAKMKADGNWHETDRENRRR